MQILFLTVFLLLNVSMLFAQQPQSWLIYFGNTKFKDSKFSLHHELQLRDYQIIGDHNQTLVRVGGQYRFSPLLQSTVGYGFIYTEAEDSPNRPFVEHRVYQEGVISHGVSRSKWRHRIRLEERFIEGLDFRGRFRYCLFGDIPLNEQGFGEQGVYLAFYDELFVNLSNDDSVQAFDRNRAYGGVGYKLKDNLGIQLGYMRQHVGKKKGTNHALLSLHHQMTWK